MSEIMNINDVLSCINKRFGEGRIHPAPANYRCPVCRDTGWEEVQIDENYRGVQECKCSKARLAENRMKASGLAGVLKEQTFDTFVTETAT